MPGFLGMSECVSGQKPARLFLAQIKTPAKDIELRQEFSGKRIEPIVSFMRNQRMPAGGEQTAGGEITG